MSFNVSPTEFPLKNFHATPRATLGWGAHRMAGIEAKAIGIKHALIVTSGLRNTGIVDEVAGALRASDISVTVYAGVTTNAKDHEAHAAHKMYREAGCDGVVSVGGGSSHDCAKAVRIIEAHDGQSIRDFNGMNTMKRPIKVPQLAVTTTSGTGSETSWASVITDTQKLYKMVIFDPNITPSAAIVDPALTRTMPPHLTAWTGMDALTHGIEAYVSRIGVRTSQGLALAAIKQISRSLRDAFGNPNNAEAREEMCWGQYSAGHAFNSAGLGLVHSLAHTLGGLLDMPHGQCNAIGLVPVERYNMVACPDRFRDIAEAMGVDTRNMQTWRAAEAALDEIERLRQDVGITQTFTTLGMKEENIERFTPVALQDVCTFGNPRQATPEDVKNIFRQCMAPGANGKN